MICAAVRCASSCQLVSVVVRALSALFACTGSRIISWAQLRCVVAWRTHSAVLVVQPHAVVPALAASASVPSCTRYVNVPEPNEQL